MKHIIQLFIKLFSWLFGVKNLVNYEDNEIFPNRSRPKFLHPRTPAAYNYFPTTSKNPEYHPRRKKLKGWQKAKN